MDDPDFHLVKRSATSNPLAIHFFVAGAQFPPFLSAAVRVCFPPPSVVPLFSSNKWTTSPRREVASLTFLLLLFLTDNEHTASAISRHPPKEEKIENRHWVKISKQFGQHCWTAGFTVNVVNLSAERKRRTWDRKIQPRSHNTRRRRFINNIQTRSERDCADKQVVVLARRCHFGRDPL